MHNQAWKSAKAFFKHRKYRHLFLLIDTDPFIFETELDWGENEWGDDVEFKSPNLDKEIDSCFLCIW